MLVFVFFRYSKLVEGKSINISSGILSKIHNIANAKLSIGIRK